MNSLNRWFSAIVAVAVALQPLAWDIREAFAQESGQVTSQTAMTGPERSVQEMDAAAVKTENTVISRQAAFETARFFSGAAPIQAPDLKTISSPYADERMQRSAVIGTGELNELSQASKETPQQGQKNIMENGRIIAQEYYGENVLLRHNFNDKGQLTDIQVIINGKPDTVTYYDSGKGSPLTIDSYKEVNGKSQIAGTEFFKDNQERIRITYDASDGETDLSKRKVEKAETFDAGGNVTKEEHFEYDENDALKATVTVIKEYKAAETGFGPGFWGRPEAVLASQTKESTSYAYGADYVLQTTSDESGHPIASVKNYADGRTEVVASIAESPELAVPSVQVEPPAESLLTERDDAGRVIRETLPDGSSNHYFYSENTFTGDSKTIVTVDASGKVTAARQEMQSGTVSDFSDVRLMDEAPSYRDLAITETILGEIGGKTAVGRVSKRSYSDGATVVYAYGENGWQEMHYEPGGVRDEVYGYFGNNDVQVYLFDVISDIESNPAGWKAIESMESALKGLDEGTYYLDLRKAITAEDGSFKIFLNSISQNAAGDTKETLFEVRFSPDGSVKRLIETLDGGHIREYDESLQLVRDTAEEARFQYDAKGRLTREISQDGAMTTHHVYTEDSLFGDSKLTFSTNAEGEIFGVQEEYGAGTVTYYTDPFFKPGPPSMKGLGEYEYPLGSVDGKTLYGRASSKRSSDGSIWKYTYGQNGRGEVRYDANGYPEEVFGYYKEISVQAITEGVMREIADNSKIWNEIDGLSSVLKTHDPSAYYAEITGRTQRNGGPTLSLEVVSLDADDNQRITQYEFNLGPDGKMAGFIEYLSNGNVREYDKDSNLIRDAAEEANAAEQGAQIEAIDRLLADFEKDMSLNFPENLTPAQVARVLQKAEAAFADQSQPFDYGGFYPKMNMVRICAKLLAHKDVFGADFKKVVAILLRPFEDAAYFDPNGDPYLRIEHIQIVSNELLNKAMDLPDEDPARSLIIDAWSETAQKVPSFFEKFSYTGFPLGLGHPKALATVAKTESDKAKVIATLGLEGKRKDIYQRFGVLALDIDAAFSEGELAKIENDLALFPDNLHDLFKRTVITRDTPLYSENAAAYASDEFGLIHIQVVKTEISFLDHVMTHEMWHHLADISEDDRLLTEKRWMRESLFEVGGQSEKSTPYGRRNSLENSAEFGFLIMQDTMGALTQGLFQSVYYRRFVGLRTELSLMEVLVKNSSGQLPFYKQYSRAGNAAVTVDSQDNITMIDSPSSGTRSHFTYTSDGFLLKSVTIEDKKTGKKETVEDKEAAVYEGLLSEGKTHAEAAKHLVDNAAEIQKSEAASVISFQVGKLVEAFAKDDISALTMNQISERITGFSGQLAPIRTLATTLGLSEQESTSLFQPADAYLETLQAAQKSLIDTQTRANNVTALQTGFGDLVESVFSKEMRQRYIARNVYDAILMDAAMAMTSERLSQAVQTYDSKLKTLEDKSKADGTEKEYGDLRRQIYRIGEILAIESDRRGDFKALVDDAQTAVDNLKNDFNAKGLHEGTQALVNQMNEAIGYVSTHAALTQENTQKDGLLSQQAELDGKVKDAIQAKSDAETARIRRQNALTALSNGITKAMADVQALDLAELNSTQINEKLRAFSMDTTSLRTQAEDAGIARFEIDQLHGKAIGDALTLLTNTANIKMAQEHIALQKREQDITALQTGFGDLVESVFSKEMRQRYIARNVYDAILMDAAMAMTSERLSQAVQTYDSKLKTLEDKSKADGTEKEYGDLRRQIYRIGEILAIESDRRGDFKALVDDAQTAVDNLKNDFNAKGLHEGTQALVNQMNEAIGYVSTHASLNEENTQKTTLTSQQDALNERIGKATQVAQAKDTYIKDMQSLVRSVATDSQLSSGTATDALKDLSSEALKNAFVDFTQKEPALYTQAFSKDIPKEDLDALNKDLVRAENYFQGLIEKKKALEDKLAALTKTMNEKISAVASDSEINSNKVSKALESMTSDQVEAILKDLDQFDEASRLQVGRAFTDQNEGRLLSFYNYLNNISGQKKAAEAKVAEPEKNNISYDDGSIMTSWSTPPADYAKLSIPYDGKTYELTLIFAGPNVFNKYRSDDEYARVLKDAVLGGIKAEKLPQNGEFEVKTLDNSFNEVTFGIHLPENPNSTIKHTKPLGDLDGKAGVSSYDAALLNNHLLGKTPLSSDALKKADVNQDGSVDAADHTLMREKVNGTRKNWPPMIGDTNDDGKLTTTDVSFITRHALKIEDLVGGSLALADADQNGKVDAADSAFIRDMVKNGATSIQVSIISFGRDYSIRKINGFSSDGQLVLSADYGVTSRVWSKTTYYDVTDPVNDPYTKRKLREESPEETKIYTYTPAYKQEVRQDKNGVIQAAYRVYTGSNVSFHFPAIYNQVSSDPVLSAALDAVHQFTKDNVKAYTVTVGALQPMMANGKVVSYNFASTVTFFEPRQPEALIINYDLTQKKITN